MIQTKKNVHAKMMLVNFAKVEHNGDSLLCLNSFAIHGNRENGQIKSTFNRLVQVFIDQ